MSSGWANIAKADFCAQRFAAGKDGNLVDGKGPVFEVIDEHTVRYTWAKPNPEFLPAIAGTLPLEVAMPAHYGKQFHPTWDRLAATVEGGSEVVVLQSDVNWEVGQEVRVRN